MFRLMGMNMSILFILIQIINVEFFIMMENVCSMNGKKILLIKP